MFDKYGISYVIKKHEQDAFTCADVARERGIRLSQVLKCMVAKCNSNLIYLMLVPGDRMLRMKKIRKIVSNDSIDLIPADKLTTDYGLRIGGISPFHFLKMENQGKAKFFLDTNVLDEEYIDISSGQLNEGILLRTKDLIDLIKPQICDITANTKTL